MKIMYNPACTKCEMGLNLLVENGINPEIINYLENPPTKLELEEIIQKLGIKPLELVRINELVFHQKYLGRNMTDEDWIEAMVCHPVLIQRPIVISENSAVIGRPPSLILSLLK